MKYITFGDILGFDDSEVIEIKEKDTEDGSESNYENNINNNKN